MPLERRKQRVRIEPVVGRHLRAPRLEHRPEALLRRPRKLLAQPGVVALIGRLVQHELQVEIEAAGLQHIAQRLQARRYHISFPAGDLRPVLAASLRQLCLRESRSQARLPDQHPARHDAMLHRDCVKAPCGRICYTRRMQRNVDARQLELETELTEPVQGVDAPHPSASNGTSGTRQANRVPTGNDRTSCAATHRASRPSAAELLETPGALLTRSHLRRLGLERRAVDAVFRALPVVALPGYSRPMIRAEEFLELVDHSTYGDDRVRPCHA